MKLEADISMECQQSQEVGRGRNLFKARVPESAPSSQHLDFRPEILIRWLLNSKTVRE